MTTKIDTFDDAETIDVATVEYRPLVFSTKDEPGGKCSACHGPLNAGVKVELKDNPAATYHLLCPGCCESIGRAAGMVRR